ncbi:dolichyl-phosphate beta-glucosyltransferase [Blyttiomyces sp. JEL0837]|nr:dolichyl-phosphate beta-glucosyltransferase [Blyttiomyces sp. JEL0837]
MIVQVIVVLASVFLAGLLYLALTANKPRKPTVNEGYYTDVISGERRKFPSIVEADSSKDITDTKVANDKDSTLTKRRGKDGLKDGESEKLVDLSVVVPAYNESQRLPGMLKETLDFLENRLKQDSTKTFEVIVVDDGSKDDTSEVALKIGKERKCAALRVLTLEKNRGKGGAVTQGMLVSRGKNVLFADADGATRFSDIDMLERELAKVSKNGLGLAVGSRAHMVKTEAVVKRSFLRNFLMYGFHTYLLILGIASIKDTQCGFKLVSRSAVATIFPKMHVEGWIFDIEMLLLAMWQNVPIAEVPVTWHEVDGTKMSLLRDSITMALDLLVIRLNYFTGIWSCKDSQ